MDYRIRFLFLIIVSVSWLTGCHTSIVNDSNDSANTFPSNYTAEYILDKAKETYIPKKALDNLNSVKISYERISFNKNDKKESRTVITLYKKKPDKYKYIIDIYEYVPGGVNKKKLELIINGDECNVYKDGLSANNESKYFSKKINSILLEVHNFRALFSLGICEDHLSSKLYRKYYYVDGNKCFKLDIRMYTNLKNFDSSLLTYYIDADSFLLRKLVGKDTVVDDIKYKKIDQFVVPEKYLEVTAMVFNKTKTYCKLNEFEINPNFPEDFFNSKTDSF